MQFTVDNAISFSVGSAAGFVLRIFLEHLLASRRSKKDYEAKRFDEAANSFRRRVLAELEGLYPVTHTWPEQVYPKFRESIEKVENAAAEFRYFLKHAQAFDVALKQYREYCSNASSDHTAARHFYPSMRTPGDTSPEQKFQEIVQHLLSFTERK
jgi:hypothetical protein